MCSRTKPVGHSEDDSTGPQREHTVAETNQWTKPGWSKATIRNNARDLRILAGQLQGLDEEVFVPDVDHTRSPSTEESQQLTIPFSVAKHEPELLMPFDQMSDVTRGAITSCLDAYFSCFDGDNDDWPMRPVADPT
ncbi:hypothetical protein [Haloarchaeobius litoreus]|uniref:Uncharacterized protein n=1 Tax=Haloarchaeobius litoreus TaxID=755306 RepID=A0ABD6DPQ3_9EURY|nr:hypothetical protein [Haloarchaeobius litoreus]